MKYYIYSLSIANGRKPIYIGITRNLTNRFKKHKYDCFKKAKVSNQKLYILLRKLGVTKANFNDKVKMKVLQATTTETRFQDEVKLRKKLNPRGNSDTMR